MVDQPPSKMRWQCNTNGCYLKKCEPNIGMFSYLFPGNISMGDFDGVVELNKAFLVLEWKSPSGEISAGQNLTFRNFTLQHDRNIVIVAHGDPQTMDVEKIAYYYDGWFYDYKAATHDDLVEMIKGWVEAVRGNR